MPSIPDFGGLAKAHNTSLIGLDILTRGQGSAPTLEEVRTYLAARNIIASIAEGSTYGSSAAVIVNALITPTHERALSNETGPTDQFVAIATADHRVAQGQEIRAFLAGMAHILNTTIVVDDSAMMVPGRMELIDLDEEQDLIHASSVSIIRGDLPLSAYPSLLFSQGDGHYGLSQGHQIVIPAPGFLAHANGASDHLGQLPNIVFTKLGQARAVSLQMTPHPQFELAVTAAPPYSPMNTYPVGTAAAHISDVLLNGGNLNYDDDLPKRPKKDPKAASDKAVPLASFDAYDRLFEAAQYLAQSPPEQLFARVAQMLDLPASIRTALLRFEYEQAPRDRTYLGDIKLTPVSALPPQFGTRFLTSLALDHTLESLASKKRSYSKRLFRTLPGTIFTAIVCAGIALFALAVLVFPDFAQHLGIDSEHTFRTIWIFVGFSVLGIYFVLAATRIKFIQRLMGRAYADGVLTKRS